MDKKIKMYEVLTPLYKNQPGFCWFVGETVGGDEFKAHGLTPTALVKAKLVKEVKQNGEIQTKQ